MKYNNGCLGLKFAFIFGDDIKKPFLFKKYKEI